MKTAYKRQPNPITPAQAAAIIEAADFIEVIWDKSPNTAMAFGLTRDVVKHLKQVKEKLKNES